MTLIPTERFHISNWIENHHKHCSMIKDAKPNSLLFEDSIVAGLKRFSNVWKDFI